MLYEAWIAHRIVSKRVTKTGTHLRPDPCIKDLIDAYQSVLDGRVPSR